MRPAKLNSLPMLVLLGVTLLVSACSSPATRSYRRGVDAFEQSAPNAEVRPAEIDADASLDDLLRFAEWSNPGLRAAALRWRAALERVPQATALPDPRLNFGYFLEEIETRTGPMDWRLGVSQSFPWPGTLDAAGSAEAARAEAERARFESERLALTEQVQRTWFELAYVNAAHEVTRAHLDLLGRWEEVARTRYATGLGNEADVIRAQVELGKVNDRVRSLDDLRRPLGARLNAALNRPAGAQLPTPALHVGGSALELDDASLLADLAVTSPDLRALEHHIEAAEQGVALADKAYYPDLSLGLDYTAISSARSPGVRGSGDDALAVTAGLSLPIWRGRRDAGARRANTLLAVARAEHDDLLNRQGAELELALYALRDASRRLSLYEDTLVPKGHESVQTTAVAYQSSKASFLEFIDAERVLLEFQLAAARARADAAQALARVERLSGVPLREESLP
ncbi:MAG: PTS cellobiose transporter subunit IIC [Planctomycetota bacterium]|nr:MAG: PTS cellobiose transporter subunit IIC [Planctomycetota bacterium]